MCFGYGGKRIPIKLSEITRRFKRGWEEGGAAGGVREVILAEG